ncbi:putative metallodependent hydrolase [Wigglesworthia glossinidia endosymbiont of Glossina morsitans morsitans (Yale colony)]|uniref:Putative metallodependent hydrolase n=1 Tax=Wigglesworthia glossinidia endosymbiont of Glossina morsitans morsitans (Yale colony) TaxID=1142511 RepID=H6Q5Q7_WIGGL|nr:TatD family hydrolase [Wigglesworthia glossinidia]AFA40962.1 putative metallodependent hydrolase [Wigglesworthia glossinidia endosymbiont of Glossina morsitans morsitans (Yale colony)]
MLLIDSHCHLDFLSNTRKNIKNIVLQAEKNHVNQILSVCISVSQFSNMISLLNKIPNVLLSFGIHPLYIEKSYDKKLLHNFATRNDVVAIGESGLDYSKIGYNSEIQKKVFLDHIEISKIVKKPLIIHSRNATHDMIKILSNVNCEISGCIMHCFTENIQIAKIFLDLGCYISFSGIVTFKNAKIIQDCARYVPDDRILIETDSPYLSPEPYRGKKNQPSYLIHIAKYIANLRNTTLKNFSKSIVKNFQKLFPKHSSKNKKNIQ